MMENYLFYNLKVALALSVFYVIYRLFLKKDTFFGNHRAFLMCSVLLSFILPGIEIYVQKPVISRIPVVFLNTFQVNADSSALSTVNAGLLLQKTLIFVYPVITIILFLKFLYRLSVLAILIVKGEKRKRGDFIFVIENKDIPVYSFFNYVFIGKNQVFPDREILAHEAVHAVQLHSLDTLIIEIVTIIQWFNPFIWLYRKELKETHEYLADAGVMKQGFSMAEYLLLLFNHAVGFNFVGLTKNFNQSLIKKRIKMMKREKSCP
ncbi:MAG: M56 family metallopeptidase, partial [Bacteroidota bacterium]|nr:M56 family metallopeptidase [Bacteroidota bacterium]